MDLPSSQDRSEEDSEVVAMLEERPPAVPLRQENKASGPATTSGGQQRCANWDADPMISTCRGEKEEDMCWSDSVEDPGHVPVWRTLRSLRLGSDSVVGQTWFAHGRICVACAKREKDAMRRLQKLVRQERELKRQAEREADMGAGGPAGAPAEQES